MFNLAFKDVILQIKYFILSIFIVLGLSLLNRNAFFILCMPVAAVWMGVMYSCTYDDKNDTNIIFASLPMKRSSIVLSKYISLLYFLIISIFFTVIFLSVVKMSGFIKVSTINSEEIIASCIPAVLLNSIYFPIYFKFGYIESRYIAAGLFFFMCFAPSLLLNSASSKKNFLQALIYIKNKPVFTIDAAMILLIAAIMIISALISVNIYKNKDL